MQRLEFPQPILPTVDHHFCATIRNHQRGMHTMPPGTDLDFAARAEKCQFHWEHVLRQFLRSARRLDREISDSTESATARSLASETSIVNPLRMQNFSLAVPVNGTGAKPVPVMFPGSRWPTFKSCSTTARRL